MQHWPVAAIGKPQIIVGQRVDACTVDDLLHGLPELVQRQLGAASIVEILERIVRVCLAGGLPCEPVNELGDRLVDDIAVRNAVIDHLINHQE